MTDVLARFKSKKISKNSKVPYTLTEILGILAMFNEGFNIDQVSKLSGRSKNTLRYKFLDEAIMMNGKSTIRSIKRFKTVEEIYNYYGEKYIDEQEVKQRIQQYKQMLKQKHFQTEKVEEEV